jgi:hypothetical protein
LQIKGLGSRPSMLKMTTNKKVKIWTIITHAFILVGFGHGVAFFLIIEIIWFPYFTKDFSFDLYAPFNSHLPVVGLTALLGQIALIFSILNKRQEVKIAFQITGLLLLWTSILYFTYTSSEDHYTHFAALTCIPFAICTIITFAGQSIKRFYNWIFN